MHFKDAFRTPQYLINPIFLGEPNNKFGKKKTVNNCFLGICKF